MNITAENCYSNMPRILSRIVESGIDGSSVADICLALCSIDVEEGTNQKEMRLNRFLSGSSEWLSVLNILKLSPSEADMELPKIQQMRLISSALILLLEQNGTHIDSPVTVSAAETLADTLKVSVNKNTDYSDIQGVVSVFSEIDDCFEDNTSCDNKYELLKEISRVCDIFEQIKSDYENCETNFIKVSSLENYMSKIFSCNKAISSKSLLESGLNESSLLKKYFRTDVNGDKLKYVALMYSNGFEKNLISVFAKILEECFESSKTYTVSVLRSERSMGYCPSGNSEHYCTTKYSILNVLVRDLFENKAMDENTMAMVLRIISRLINGTPMSYESILQKVTGDVS